MVAPRDSAQCPTLITRNHQTRRGSAELSSKELGCSRKPQAESWSLREAKGTWVSCSPVDQVGLSQNSQHSPLQAGTPLNHVVFGCPTSETPVCSVLNWPSGLPHAMRKDSSCGIAAQPLAAEADTKIKPCVAVVMVPFIGVLIIVQKPKGVDQTLPEVNGRAF